MAEYIRLSILDAFVCSQDPAQELNQRFCNDTLKRAFNGAPTATVETIATNMAIVSDRLNPAVAKKVTVINPTSWNTFDQSLNDARKFFNDFESDFCRQMYSNISSYR